MHRRIIAASLAAAATTTVALATPATGQSLGDTFNQLRSTIRQLGGGKARGASPTASAPTAAVAARTDDAGDATEMVPASVVVDDPSDTALERAAILPRRVETFDVRGFKLGMSPREAGRIARRERFRRRWNSVFQTTGTFELEAARLANQKLNRPVERSSKSQLSKVQAFDPAGNEVNVEFTLEPSGPRLSRLTYNAKLDGGTPVQAGNALVKRYGVATAGQPGPGHMSWKNSSRAYDLASPSLGAVIDDDSIMLFLDQSVDYRKEAFRRMEARAVELAASKGGGLRF